MVYGVSVAGVIVESGMNSVIFSKVCQKRQISNYLMGQLRLVATKDKRKVMDKKVDFDTIDLLTKRFNSKKKYSDIAKLVFDELNQLSEIPIHKSSKKFKKLGSGVVYFNDANDLIDRMELLGGSILAGNNGVKEEFSQIAHKLNQLGLINNKQLIDLLQQYIIK